ncbi:MAG: alanyl-tRNA editing protein [Nanoarchaeota archaeon]|nr:alanyl-tRNA editing protein [Nanoarchaeota archaeon]MBU1321915.1 alanyl-tRNA editing protein [Nanoarchaeota archaeon]MBU1597608.1 alanyl-tRNA editing protein [Nanoarchaeota archaeon]MBU2440976.1 alanyl-tRNA editing protein [Nanoarchaeota archaeon]
MSDAEKNLYLLDCYMKEFEATVESVKEDKFVVLDKTAFYPNAGGQPYDTGKFIAEDGTEYNVVFVGKFGGVISHEIEVGDKPGLKPSDKIKGVIDWDRRYRLMRMHTAAHVISIIIEKDCDALITGNQLGLDKSRIDFNLEDFDRDKFAGYMDEANEIIKKGAKVTLSLLPKEEAVQKYERLTNLAKGFSDEIKEIRIVEIEGVTAEACGGTHLKDISEIKGVKLVKLDNKGKNNRRLYYELVD